MMDQFGSNDNQYNYSTPRTNRTNTQLASPFSSRVEQQQQQQQHQHQHQQQQHHQQQHYQQCQQQSLQLQLTFFDAQDSQLEDPDSQASLSVPSQTYYDQATPSITRYVPSGSTDLANSTRPAHQIQHNQQLFHVPQEHAKAQPPQNATSLRNHQQIHQPMEDLNTDEDVDPVDNSDWVPRTPANHVIASQFTPTSHISATFPPRSSGHGHRRIQTATLPSQSYHQMFENIMRTDQANVPAPKPSPTAEASSTGLLSTSASASASASASTSVPASAPTAVSGTTTTTSSSSPQQKKLRKNRPGHKFGARKRSWVWSWFKQDPSDYNLAICNVCNKSIRRIESDKGSPKKLSEHLKTHKIGRSDAGATGRVNLFSEGETGSSLSYQAQVQNQNQHRPQSQHYHLKQQHHRHQQQQQQQQQQQSDLLNILRHRVQDTNNATMRSKVSPKESVAWGDTQSETIAQTGQQQHLPRLQQHPGSHPDPHPHSHSHVLSDEFSEFDSSPYNPIKFHKHIMQFLSEYHLPLKTLRSKSFLQVIYDLRPQSISDLKELTTLYDSVMEVGRIGLIREDQQHDEDNLIRVDESVALLTAMMERGAPK